MECCNKNKGRVIYLKPKEHNCPFCGHHFENINGRETCPNCGTEVIGISRVTGYCAFDERFPESKVKERENRRDNNGANNKTYE